MTYAVRFRVKLGGDVIHCLGTQLGPFDTVADADRAGRSTLQELDLPKGAATFEIMEEANAPSTRKH
jgi:hypothetical protein